MPTKNNSAIVTGIQKYFLLGTLLLLVIMFLLFLAPFITTLLIAAIIVTAIYPLHRLLNKTIHIPGSFSALISLLLTAGIVLFPFVLFIFFIADQAGDAYLTIGDKINIMIESGEYDSVSKILRHIPFSDKLEKIVSLSPFSTADILQTARDMVGTASTFLLGQTTNIIKHLSFFIIHTIVFLLALFYFLRDGDRLINYAYSLMPLSENYRKELFKKLNHLSYGIIYGIFGAAILQGFLVGVGFAIVNIENASFWGAVAALFSPLPYIGTAVVWVPAVISLVIGGHWIAATFLCIWSIIVVGLSDNFIKPYLIGSHSSLHPMAILLTLLGGAFAFGIKGLIFGPFLLTVTLSFLHIYQLEYKSVLGSSHLERGKKKVAKVKKKK